MDAPNFLLGDAAPWFNCRSSSNPRFHFSSAAGRFIILCFHGSLSRTSSEAIMSYALKSISADIDDNRISFFGISVDPNDEHHPIMKNLPQGVRMFWDDDGAVSRLYGTTTDNNTQEMVKNYKPFTLILDPTLRVWGRLSHDDPATHNERLHQVIRTLPLPANHAGVAMSAPVLIVPRILEENFCRELIEHYHQGQPEDSGFMREQDGKTIGIVDHQFKRRTDCEITTEALRDGLRARMIRRLLPEIKKSFQYDVTRIERFIVARYDGQEGGFFRPHRDNSTPGTAHRRFACTINLNAEDYEGGELRFPEFGNQTYRAPTGGAVIFSCSLLHEATPVTSGVRFATLPFLYDDEAAKIRQQNMGSITSG